MFFLYCLEVQKIELLVKLTCFVDNDCVMQYARIKERFETRVHAPYIGRYVTVSDVLGPMALSVMVRKTLFKMTS